MFYYDIFNVYIYIYIYNIFKIDICSITLIYKEIFSNEISTWVNPVFNNWSAIIRN